MHPEATSCSNLGTVLVLKDPSVRYIADGSCYNDCNGSKTAADAALWSTDWSSGAGAPLVGGTGQCRAGLCVCEDGWTGADCSVPLDTLSSDGTPVEGRVGRGGTFLHFFSQPEPFPSLKPPQRVLTSGQNVHGCAQLFLSLTGAYTPPLLSSTSAGLGTDRLKTPNVSYEKCLRSSEKWRSERPRRQAWARRGTTA